MTPNTEYILKKYAIELGPRVHMPIEISNIGRNDLPTLLDELDLKTGAEVGVLGGEYAEILLQKNPGSKLYAIDPWIRTDGYKDYRDTVLKQYEEESRKRLSRYNSKIIKKTSMDAVKDFEDNSLDFVYIDGNHEFKNVVMDIAEWIKKVKVGGIISGHDFRGYVDWRDRYGRLKQVVEAVVGYTTAYHVRPWFVLGNKSYTRGEGTRDKERSWMWIKEESHVR